jgi:hypothetical protein
MRGCFSPAALSLVVGLLGLLVGGGARAQPDTDPPPAAGPATPAELAAPAAPVAQADVPAPADPLTPKDRILFNAGLDALVMGDLNQARSLFVLLVRQGETPAARTAAAVIVDRIGGLEQRRAAGLLPPLRAPALAETPARALRRTPAQTSARAPVVATTTVLGLALWGWTVPVMLGLNDGDGRAFLGVYMLTATSSFVLPYVLTARHPPSPAQANLIFYGGTRGAEWGLLLSNLMFGRAGGDSSHERAFATSLLLGSVAGVVGGGLLAPALDLSPGDARTIAAMGDYGLFAGFAVARLFGFHELGSTPQAPGGGGFPPFNSDEFGVPQDVLDKRARATSAAGLVGTGLGLLGGRVLALHRQNTWGDGEVMRGAGVLGVMAAATAASAIDMDDSDNALVAVLALGGGVGLVGGDFLVRNTNYSPSEALMVDLALVAGGLGGAGLTYLFTETESATAYLLTATLGAAVSGGVVSWALSQRQSKDDAHATAPRVALLPRFGDRGPSGLQLVGSF